MFCSALRQSSRLSNIRPVSIGVLLMRILKGGRITAHRTSSESSRNGASQLADGRPYLAGDPSLLSIERKTHQYFSAGLSLWPLRPARPDVFLLAAILHLVTGEGLPSHTTHLGIQATVSGSARGVECSLFYSYGHQNRPAFSSAADYDHGRSNRD